jgi:hypothetical protein
VSKTKDKIYVYDAFTELYDKHHLTPMEMYLYCFLYVNRSHKYVVIISIETIHQTMPIKFHNSRPSSNKSRIVDTILSLKDKGILSFDVDDLTLQKKSGRNIGLKISFDKMKDGMGYIQIAYDDFFKTDDINFFYITNAIVRYDNTKYKGNGLHGRWISEKEFSDLLEVSEETFRKYAKELIKQKRLYKLTGKRKEDSSQRDKNRYRTIPFPESDNSGYESRLDGNVKEFLPKRKERKSAWESNPF